MLKIFIMFFFGWKKCFSFMTVSESDFYAWIQDLKPGPNEDESWLSWEFSSTLIDYHETLAKWEKTPNDSQEKFEQVQIRWESLRAHESFRSNESESFELSATLILVWPGLKIIIFLLSNDSVRK